MAACILASAREDIMTSLLNANALVIVPEGGVEVRPGDTAKAMMLEWPEV